MSPNIFSQFFRVGPVFYLANWFLFSCILIFTNRQILVEYKFPFPFSLTTWHLTIAAIVTRVLRRHSQLLAGIDEVEKKLTWKKWMKSVLPIGALFSISLACANYACKNRLFFFKKKRTLYL